MGKLNSETGKLKVNGKEPDKKKSKNNQCVGTKRGIFLLSYFNKEAKTFSTNF